MKIFEYGKQEIGQKEIGVSVSSMIIGVGVLTQPRFIADATGSIDGWMSIVAAGMIVGFAAWAAAALAAKFPKQSFLSYTSLLVSRPAAVVLTLLMFLYFFTFTAYEIRMIADISKLYLFNRTPVEAIALAFQLVVVYAVAGSRIGVLRLNLLFLPIVLTVTALLLAFSTGLLELNNLRPFFIADWKEIAGGIKESSFAFLGFEIVLFYVSLMNRPEHAPRAAVIGVAVPACLYLLVYLCALGTFSVEGVVHVVYPTIELAKEIRVPGEFFERFESVFFVIWTMTIFNTTCMALDVSVMALQSFASKVPKITWVVLMSPIVYIAAMLPQDTESVSSFGEMISYAGLGLGLTVSPLLLLIAKWRGRKNNG